MNPALFSVVIVLLLLACPETAGWLFLGYVAFVAVRFL